MLGVAGSGQGHEMHLINVHKKSIGLTPEDKAGNKEAHEKQLKLQRETGEEGGRSQLLTEGGESVKHRSFEARTVGTGKTPSRPARYAGVSSRT